MLGYNWYNHPKFEGDTWWLKLESCPQLSQLAALAKGSSYGEARSWLDKSGFSRDSLTQIEPHCGAICNGHRRPHQKNNTTCFCAQRHMLAQSKLFEFISRSSRAPLKFCETSKHFGLFGYLLNGPLNARSLRSDVAIPCRTQTKDSKCISCIVCLQCS